MISQTYINNVKSYFLEKEKNDKVRKRKERDDIILKLKTIKLVWQKYGISRAYLFGAFSDMTFNKSSDIDIAIEPEINLEKLLQIYCEVSKCFKREIDLRLLNELPFADKIRKKGLIIYERKNSNT